MLMLDGRHGEVAETMPATQVSIKAAQICTEDLKNLTYSTYVFPGHGTMIGTKKGKILAYSYWCKICRFCQSASDGHVKEHDCRKNWDKSSKAMESDMAIEVNNVGGGGRLW